MGCLTPLGPTLPDTWARVRAGESGIAPITRFDASSLPTRFAGEVPDFDPHSVIDAKWVRRMDRFQQLAVSAAIEALADSSFSITAHNAERIGVIVGSGVGGIETFTQQVRRMDERGVDRVSPFLITMMIVDLAAGLIAILLGAKGPNFATVSACATGGMMDLREGGGTNHGRDVTETLLSPPEGPWMSCSSGSSPRSPRVAGGRGCCAASRVVTGS